MWSACCAALLSNSVASQLLFSTNNVRYQRLKVLNLLKVSVGHVQLFCLVKKWHITEDRIDLVHSCCGTKEDTVYVRRVKDVSLGGNCCIAVLCCGRNTVIITAADDTHPELRLTAWGARRIFHKLRDAKEQRQGIVLEDNE
jgi:hypothetical protein